MSTLVEMLNGLERNVPETVYDQGYKYELKRYNINELEDIARKACTPEYTDDDKLEAFHFLNKETHFNVRKDDYSFLLEFYINLKTSEAKKKLLFNHLIWNSKRNWEGDIIKLANGIHRLSDDKIETEFLKICLEWMEEASYSQMCSYKKMILDIVNICLCGNQVPSSTNYLPLTIDNVSEEKCMEVFNVIKGFSRWFFIEEIKYQLTKKISKDEIILDMCNYINFYGLYRRYDSTRGYIAHFAKDKLKSADNIISLIKIISQQKDEKSFMENEGIIAYAFDKKTELNKIIEAINSMESQSWRVGEVLLRLREQTRQIEAANNKDEKTKVAEMEKAEGEAAEITIECISYDSDKKRISSKFKCKSSILTVINDMKEEKEITELLCQKSKLFTDEEKFTIIQEHKFQKDENIIRILETMTEIDVIRKTYLMIKDPQQRIIAVARTDENVSDILAKMVERINGLNKPDTTVEANSNTTNVGSVEIAR